MLLAANPTASLHRHIQHEIMNATAVCFAVDGDPVANKVGCRRASWYLRTLSSTSFGKSPKLMDLIMYDGLDRKFSTIPTCIESCIRDGFVMRLATQM